MKVLDAELYPKKKKKTKKVEQTGWSQAQSGDSPKVKRQVTGTTLQLGGKRGKRKEEKKNFEEAEAALQRQTKVPEDNKPADPMKQGIFAEAEDESDDLEEESSSHDEEPVPVPAPVVQSKPREEQSEEPQEAEEKKEKRPESIEIVSIDTLMEEIERDDEEQKEAEIVEAVAVEEESPPAAAEEEQGSEEGDTGAVLVMMVDEMEELMETNSQDEEGADAALEEVTAAPVEGGEDPDASIVMDWEGLMTEATFELGEEVDEAVEREKEKRMKRPPSVLFKIVNKDE
jgi:hypothetical protein